MQFIFKAEVTDGTEHGVPIGKGQFFQNMLEALKFCVNFFTVNGIAGGINMVQHF